MKVPALVCMLLLCSAPLGFAAKVHEVLWDIPEDGLQLPSISTAKCGDTIRFRCPLHATHGLYKLEETNYNGTCPKSYDAPMVGTTLFEPKKGCDFSITLEDGPDFYITSHVPGACQKNMKVYVHAVCIKSESNFVSGLFNNLPALPSLPSFRSTDRLSRRAAAAQEPAQPQTPGLPAAGYAGVVTGDVPFMNGADSPTLGATPQLRPASSRGMAGGAVDSAVLEAAKQSGAADVRPVLASLLMAIAAVALML